MPDTPTIQDIAERMRHIIEQCAIGLGGDLLPEGRELLKNLGSINRQADKSMRSLSPGTRRLLSKRVKAFTAPLGVLAGHRGMDASLPAGDK